MTVLSGGVTQLVDGNAVNAPDLGHVVAPVSVEALRGLLPSPEQLDAALGVQGLTVKGSTQKKTTPRSVKTGNTNDFWHVPRDRL